ncbi:MAG: hypothetical protein M3Z25_09400 [Actinomycetota bacterium]|nr:hypothetical protein [Actinomycetota bacterium]
MSDPSDVEARRVEGLAATQEAVQLRRELVESNRDAHLPDLVLQGCGCGVSPTDS